MCKRILLTAAVIGVLLAALPAEAAKAGAGRTTAPGGSGSGASGYVPPVIHEEGPLRVHFIGLLHTGKQDPGREFSARTLRDLLILVEYRSLSAGPHTQRLKLFLPDGALYQQFTTAFETPPEDGARGKGYRGPAWQPVETRLPVGGTWITEHALYGSWRFEVYLDAAPQPIVSHRFTLTK